MEISLWRWECMTHVFSSNLNPTLWLCRPTSTSLDCDIEVWGISASLHLKRSIWTNWSSTYQLFFSVLMYVLFVSTTSNQDFRLEKRSGDQPLKINYFTPMCVVQWVHLHCVEAAIFLSSSMTLHAFIGFSFSRQKVKFLVSLLSLNNWLKINVAVKLSWDLIM